MSVDLAKRLKDLARNSLDDTVKLTSELIKIPSLSGQEREVAEYTLKTMQDLDYDEAWIDRAGNVIGKMKGTGGGKSIIFNSHLDIVHEGDETKWKYPPYSGQIAEGKVWGRGASDTKGAFAAQIYAAHNLKKEGLLPAGDVYVTGVVHEEDSGVGSMVLTEDLTADYAVVGEATSTDIAIGCRGRFRFDLHIKGKSCHASRPEWGVNPHFFLARFIEKLKDYKLEEDDIFGKSSLAPTLIRTSEKNTNVIPAELILTIDYRNIPSETPEMVTDKLEKIAQSCYFEGIDFWFERIKHSIACYTGLTRDAYEGLPAFSIDPDHPLVTTGKSALEEIYGREITVKTWAFATDSGFYDQAGISVIGFAPAQIELCHTMEEHIGIDMLEEGILGNMALILKLAE